MLRHLVCGLFLVVCVWDVRDVFVDREQYGASCDNYPDKPMNFTNMVLKSLSGSNVVPSWSANHGQCEGGAKIISATDVQIYGKDMP